MDANGTSGLYLATEDGSEDTVRLLLEKAMQLNVQNPTGYTALHIAAKAGHRSVATFSSAVELTQIAVICWESRRCTLQSKLTISPLGSSYRFWRLE